MIIALVGPTCSGKSSLAISLAKYFHGEIVNCDAFQVYQELNIGTAKPSKEDMQDIPHHLFDYVPINRPYSVKDYQKDFREVVDKLIKKNVPIIIVGGTGLYLKASIMDYEFKDETYSDMSKFDDYTNQELYDILFKIDPEDAKKMHPNNRKRVLRSIAIFHLNGKSKTELIKEQEHKFLYDVNIFALNIDKEVLHKRISDRVDKMFENGLMEEAAKLSKKYGKNHQCFQAIGYREILASPNEDVDVLKEEIKKDTRNYAKRQITFFKHQFDAKWINNFEEIITLLNKEI